MHRKFSHFHSCLPLNDCWSSIPGKIHELCTKFVFAFENCALIVKNNEKKERRIRLGIGHRFILWILTVFQSVHNSHAKHIANYFENTIYATKHTLHTAHSIDWTKLRHFQSILYVLKFIANYAHLLDQNVVGFEASKLPFELFTVHSTDNLLLYGKQSMKSLNECANQTVVQKPIFEDPFRWKYFQ